MINEKDVMLQVQAGQLDKLAVLYESNKVKLFNYFRKKGNSRAQSEDIVQETFMKILAYRSSFNGSSTFSSWMYGIARNTAADLYRKNKGNVIHEDIDDHEVVSEHCATEQAVSSQQQNIFDESLASISAEHREIIILSRFQQLNYHEISSEYSTQNVILHIKVPKRTRLDIELYKGGDVEINNISGAIEAEAFKGSIIANGVSGPMVAETHNTDIVVSFDVLNQQNPTSLTSHSGNIDISINKNTSAKINVQSYKGEILSGLATEFFASEDVQRKNKGGKQKIVIGGMMSAEVNGGGQDITLATYNGNVYVRTK